MVRSAYTPRTNDDDFSQPGILVRDVFNDAQRTKLVDQVAGSLLGGVREPVLSKAFAYWKNIDADAGRRIEEKVRAGAASKPAEGMGERLALAKDARVVPAHDDLSSQANCVKIGRAHV